MRIYISGAITSYLSKGQDLYEVKERFAKAAREWEDYGHTPITPFYNGLPIKSPYLDHLLSDLRLLSDCDAIYMLSDWQQSKGAQLEHEYARIFGKHIYYQNHNK